MEVENIAPFSILAVTFTNKAAKEMRGRIESLMGRSLHNMWIGTFHGLRIAYYERTMQKPTCLRIFR